MPSSGHISRKAARGQSLALSNMRLQRRRKGTWPILCISWGMRSHSRILVRIVLAVIRMQFKGSSRRGRLVNGS